MNKRISKTLALWRLQSEQMAATLDDFGHPVHAKQMRSATKTLDRYWKEMYGQDYLEALQEIYDLFEEALTPPSNGVLH